MCDLHKCNYKSIYGYPKKIYNKKTNSNKKDHSPLVML